MPASPKRSHFGRLSQSIMHPRMYLPRRARSVRRLIFIVVLLGAAVFLADILQDMFSSSSSGDYENNNNNGYPSNRFMSSRLGKGISNNLKLSSSESELSNLQRLQELDQVVMTVTHTHTHTRTATAWATATATATHTVFFAGGDGADEVARELEALGDAFVLGNHTYRADGLLEVNPDGPHPIFELMRRADEEWAEKHRKASKTLGEACEEYERRYGRVPPKGFDAWWSYVEKHSVLLPDEYDQIHKDLEPFWGINPSDLQTIQRDWEGHADSYTLGKDDEVLPTPPSEPMEYIAFAGPYPSSIRIVNYTLPGAESERHELAAGAFVIMELLEEVEKYIPPFRAVFSPHDNPNLHTDWELRDMAIQAAEKGEYIDVQNPPEVKLHGWISACPPFSPAWRDPIPYPSSIPSFPTSLIPPPAEPVLKTFIHNHALSMSPCLHPSHLLKHGQFLSHRTGPVPHRILVPQFSYSPTMLHHDIITALPINWVDDVLPREDDKEWEDKEDSRLEWRGRNTGMWHGDEMVWWEGQRGRLVRWANGADVGDGKATGNWSVLRSRGRSNAESSSLKDTTAIDKNSYPDSQLPVGPPTPVPSSLWAPAMFDIAYATSPINCEPSTCAHLSSIYEFRKPHSHSHQLRFQYIIDVDGNGWSSRFKRLITSNSLVFKSTVYPEWWLDRVAPWKHYVPVQNELGDLLDAVHFFRGDVSGKGGHPGLARKIAKEGRDWSRRYWRREDMVAYMFRLFLEYARVMNSDRGAMSFNYSSSSSSNPSSNTPRTAHGHGSDSGDSMNIFPVSPPNYSPEDDDAGFMGDGDEDGEVVFGYDQDRDARAAVDGEW